MLYISSVNEGVKQIKCILCPVDKPMLYQQFFHATLTKTMQCMCVLRHIF